MDADRLIQTMVELISTWGLQALGAIAVLAIGWMAARWARAVALRTLGRSHLDATLVPFFSGLIYYGLMTFVLIAVLNLFGVQTTSFIAVMGAAGFAVGLALQGTLATFASGVMLLIFRPFRVGDVIEAGGIAGTVQEVGLFTTTLNAPDNVRIIVPNSAIYGQTIKNIGANGTRRNDLIVRLSYTDDVGKAIQTIQRVLTDDGRVLSDPAPQVAVDELGEFSVSLAVRPWSTVENYQALRWDLTRRIKEELVTAGCSFPSPPPSARRPLEGRAVV